MSQRAVRFERSPKSDAEENGRTEEKLATGESHL